MRFRHILHHAYVWVLAANNMKKRQVLCKLSRPQKLFVFLRRFDPIQDHRIPDQTRQTNTGVFYIFLFFLWLMILLRGCYYLKPLLLREALVTKRDLLILITKVMPRYKHKFNSQSHLIVQQHFGSWNREVSVPNTLLARLTQKVSQNNKIQLTIII